MVTEKVLPPILNPFLYGVVCLILEITQLSGAPNPAREPVSGWIQPIVMALVPPAPELAPLMPELHAWSSPPAPMTAAPAPPARSRLRRLMLPAGLMLSDCAVWSLIRNGSPYEVAPEGADLGAERLVCGLYGDRPAAAPTDGCLVRSANDCAKLNSMPPCLSTD